LRKVSCGFLGATQVWEQVATEVKAAVLGNTAIKIVGPVQHNDASVLSREMYCSIDFIRGMQRQGDEPFAPWAFYVNGMMKKAARVVVPFGVLEKMPKVDPSYAELRSLIAEADHELADIRRILGKPPDYQFDEDDIRERLEQYENEEEEDPFAQYEDWEPPEQQIDSNDDETTEDHSKGNAASKPAIKPGKDWD
jgi:hypothetical protein